MRALYGAVNHHCSGTFGESHLDEVAKDFNIPIIGRVPIDSKLAAACDKGMIELFEGDYMNDAVKAIDEMK